MTENLLQKLEDFRVLNNLTNAQLAQLLEIPENYLYRWRKKNQINGIYAKYLTLFLKERELVAR